MARDRDHYTAAQDAIDGAESGFEFLDPASSPAQYALLAIGHSLVR
jgi:hypothetical protein